MRKKPQNTRQQLVDSHESGKILNDYCREKSDYLAMSGMQWPMMIASRLRCLRIGVIGRNLGMLLMLAAAGTACWLACLTLSGREVPGCGMQHSCSTVLSSRWAYLAGILPVSLIGMATYLATLVAWHFRALRLGLFLQWGIVFGALWFISLQLFIVRSFCPSCCVAHALAVSAVITHSIMTRQRSENFHPQADRFSSFLAAAVSVVLFAFAQYFGSVPVNYQVYEVASKSTEIGKSNESVTASATSQIEINQNGIVTIFGDQELRLSVSAVPSLTHFSPVFADERTSIPLILLQDWTCNHCHMLHKELVAHLAQSKYPRTILCIPAYRDADGERVHRMMLTAWLHSRELYKEAEAAIINNKLKPLPDAVESYFFMRSGPEWSAIYQRFAPTVDSYLSLGAKVLAKSDTRLSAATLPQLIAPLATLVGSADQDVVRMFFESIDTPPLYDDALLGSNRSVSATESLNHVPQTQMTQTGPVKNASRLEFQGSPITLPEIQVGEKNAVSVYCSNTGNEPLEILGVRTSCGCTVVDQWKQTIPPGETGHISLVFQAPHVPGRIIKSFGLRCNAANADADGYVTAIFSVEVVRSVQSSSANPTVLDQDQRSLMPTDPVFPRIEDFQSSPSSTTTTSLLRPASEK